MSHRVSNIYVCISMRHECLDRDRSGASLCRQRSQIKWRYVDIPRRRCARESLSWHRPTWRLFSRREIGTSLLPPRRLSRRRSSRPKSAGQPSRDVPTLEQAPALERTLLGVRLRDIGFPFTCRDLPRPLFSRTCCPGARDILDLYRPFSQPRTFFIGFGVDTPLRL